jgi:hypothetical protein
MSLDEVAEAAVNDGESSKSSSFTIKKLKLRYKQRKSELDPLTLYEFAAHHYLPKGQRVAPNFFGFNDRPRWPLDEEYSRVMLMLHKPWREGLEELRDPVDHTYATALAKHMFDDHFPQLITAEIMQRRSQWTFKDTNGSSFVDTGGVDATPTSFRDDERNSDAADACANQIPNDADLPDEDEDISADLFESLPDPPADYDWSAGRRPGGETWLADFKERYYQEHHGGVVHGTSRRLVLFDPGTYKPENARGLSQQLLVYGVIYQLYQWHLFRERESQGAAPPPSLFFYVQGNPGSGKTFTQRTQINTVRRYFGEMEREQAMAPTGTAASLLCGRTSFRLLALPTGPKALEEPTNDLDESVLKVQAFIVTMSKMFGLFSDESSMATRHHLFWTKHRIESARRYLPDLTPDAAGPGGPTFSETLHAVQQQSYLRYIHERPYGGLPIFGMYGDCHQLPPVGARSHYDRTPSPRSPACEAGRFVFRDFISPLDDENVKSTTVVMDSVFRQEDGPFKDALLHIREGTVSLSDEALFLSRDLLQLPEAERAIFVQKALYLMPTWKRTHPITREYLLELNRTPGTHIAKVISKYEYTKSPANHVKRDIQLSARSPLCRGAKVMILLNFVVELNIKNGTTGEIVDIVYEDSKGPLCPSNPLPLYVVVDIPSLLIPAEYDPWDADNPTHIPIPVVTASCESRCCHCKTIPLRVCKAITIHKGQGMTIGENREWTHVVVGMPNESDRTQPGLELVGLSRPTDLCYLAVLAAEGRCTNYMFGKLGKSPGCDQKRLFEKELRDRQANSQAWLVGAISDLDGHHRTFNGGCDVLLNWYNQQVGPLVHGTYDVVDI